MFSSVVIDLGVIVVAVLLLVTLAARWNIAYPILLVLGGIAIGYIPAVPELQMPPDVVLLIFLPPLLYWESVSAPTSEVLSASGLWWLFQLAFGLVVVTMIAVAAVAHAIIPGMAWAVALVLGAVVGSTDEVAFAPIVERVQIPRHVLATIEGESLVNDATSLVLYGIAVTAVVTGTFSIASGIGALALSVIGGILIGIAAGVISGMAWRLIKNDSLQALISLMTPYVAYLPAYYIHASAVLAAVAAGFTVTNFTPYYLTSSARLRVSGFWVTIVFVLNAFIFVYVGMQFHSILSSLSGAFTPMQLTSYGIAISLTVILVRLLWVFAQGLVPETNEPEHEEGKADWSHVAVLAWSGMRGGVSLAAALAIPIETSVGFFPLRNLIIFLTFCVLLATLVGQGGTLPLLLRLLQVRDDGADEEEERVALAATAKAALKRLEEQSTQMPQGLYRFLKGRYGSRWSEFTSDDRDGDAAREAHTYRHVTRDLIHAQRATLNDLLKKGKVDNTVFRRVQRLLDLEEEEIAIMEMTGRPDIED